MGKNKKKKYKSEPASEEQLRKHKELSAVRDQLQLQVKETKRIITDLEESYANYKSYFPVFRYKELKTMIKEAKQNFHTIQTQHSETATRLKALNKQVGSITRLLQQAEGFAADAEHATHAAEMSASDLEDEIKTVENDIVELNKELNPLHERLEKLEHEYETSKNHNPATRYGLMKNMIKVTFRNQL